jgi:dCMP deaminase
MTKMHNCTHLDDCLKGIKNMSERVSKINYYLDIAQTVAERSTCMRRHFGAIIVKDDVIVSTGYNGAPRGRENCTDINYCIRDKLQIPRGERYELCRSVHAEANAIIAAARERMLGATLYMVCVNPKDGSLYAGTSSCMMCKRLVINAGIETVIVRDTKDEFRIIPVSDWIENDDSLTGIFGY